MLKINVTTKNVLYVIYVHLLHATGSTVHIINIIVVYPKSQNQQTHNWKLHEN